MDCSTHASIYLFLTALFGSAVHAVTITRGPSDITVEVNEDFELPCEVSGRTANDALFWRLFPHNSNERISLFIETHSKNSSRYTLRNNTINLQVKNPNYENDGVYECEVGTAKKFARVYVYDKPDSMSLEWQHGENREDSVKAGGSYKLKCTSINSHPPAEHVYYKDGVKLNTSNIEYQFSNTSITGYGDTVSYLPFTPTETDVRDKSTIKCSAKLWTKTDAQYAQFNVNSATEFTLSLTITVLAILMYSLH